MGNCTIHFLPAMAGDCFVLEFVNKECIIILESKKFVPLRSQ